MVSLYVHFEVLFKTVLAQEPKNSCSIEIVLVLCRLLGLGFNVEVALVTDRACVINGHFHKTGHIVKLQTHVGVQESFVALAAAPEYVAVAAELYSSLNSLFDLCRSVCKNVSGG